jgi:hypothetical protein
MLQLVKIILSRDIFYILRTRQMLQLEQFIDLLYLNGVEEFIKLFSFCSAEPKAETVKTLLRTYLERICDAAPRTFGMPVSVARKRRTATNHDEGTIRTGEPFELGKSTVDIADPLYDYMPCKLRRVAKTIKKIRESHRRLMKDAAKAGLMRSPLEPGTVYNSFQLMDVTLPVEKQLQRFENEYKRTHVAAVNHQAQSPSALRMSSSFDNGTSSEDHNTELNQVPIVPNSDRSYSSSSDDD